VTMDEASSNNAQAVIDVVQRLHNPRDLIFTDPQFAGQHTTLAVIPKGMELHSVKKFHDEWLERPRRLKGTAIAESLQSFCELVKQHKSLDTVTFASNNGGYGLEAVIDYHVKGALDVGSTPSFCGHRIRYRFPQTESLKAWTEASKWYGQGAFAQFLDAQRFDLIDPLDIEKPDEKSIVYEVMFRSTERAKRGEMKPEKVFASPSEIMELVETLSGHSRTKFTEVKTDRYGGMRATIEKEGRVEGDEKIPTLFLVAIAAFVGGDRLVLPARIRAQVGANGLQLCTELVGVDRILEKAFEQAIIETHAFTGCPVFRGSPEA
jgi:hypothetical protein